MKLQLSIKWLIISTTIACGLSALYSWHLREKDAAVRAALQHQKKIEGHAKLHSQISSLFAGKSHIDKILGEFVRQLPNVKRGQPKFSRSYRASDSAITYNYLLKDKTEIVAFRILGEYKRDHLDPHVFTVRYADTANNKAAVDFLETAIRSQYKFKPDFTLKHEPVEVLPPTF